jgi:hypothetical protein
MLKFIARIGLFGVGLFVTYMFGRDTIEPIWYSATGVQVEGRISGFLAGRNHPSVQREPDGVRKGKRRARRPVFVFPTAPNGTDSLEARSSTRVLATFSNYALHERVTVVFPKDNPQNAHILGWQLIGVAFLCTLFGLYMTYMGLTGRGG